MGNTSDYKRNGSVKKPLKHICAGLLAHVDAGKTTLSEGMLYLSGSIRGMGRVDHGNAFLDTYELERERGITIFSKQAVLRWGDMDLTLLDTPGHVDFSAEMERVLQVLDCGILIISAADGIQSHTLTLWRLLKRYGIPVFLFVNKMDRPDADRERILRELKERQDEGCVDMEAVYGAHGGESAGAADAEQVEELALCDEAMTEEYLETGTLSDASVRRAVRERKLFPCWFGSALRAEGIEALLDGVARWLECPGYPEEFGAKVYKIGRDAQGNRLTYLRVTGGTLNVKETPAGLEGKVNQIRI